MIGIPKHSDYILGMCNWVTPKKGSKYALDWCSDYAEWEYYNWYYCPFHILCWEIYMHQACWPSRYPTPTIRDLMIQHKAKKLLEFLSGPSNNNNS
jgi:hypothetical protein